MKFDLDVTDDVTGQVEVRMFNFLGFVTSASTISMLSTNKANESAWILSLTFVSISSCLCDHNTSQGHLRSPGKKRSNKKSRDLELRYMVLGPIFARNATNDTITLFEASKSVKKPENHGKVPK